MTVSTLSNTTTQQRPIHTIAQEIKKDWGSSINFAAKPYLDAMLTLTNKNDIYVCDSAESIILYFLGNARTYRGETAKRLKAELKALK